MTERDDQLLQRVSDVEIQCASVLTELRQFEQAVNNVRAQDLANINRDLFLLGGRITNLEGQVSQLQGQISQGNNQISLLPGILNDLQLLDARLRRLGG